MSSATAPAASRPVPYTRLATATPGHRWWRPLVSLVVAVAAWVWFQLLFMVVFLEAWLVLALATGAVDASGLDAEVVRILTALSEGSISTSPASFVFTMLTIISAIPAVWLGTLAGGSPRFGLLSSVVGRLRWRRLLAAVPLAVAAFVATALVDGWLRGGAEQGLAWHPVEGLWLALLLVVLLVPFQSAAEEYLMRGLGLQVFGAWARPAWIPALATSAIFASMHWYNVWGLLAVFAFGLTAAAVTIRTGGLEASIAMHAVNNVLIFGYESFTSDTSGSDEGSGDWLGFVTQTVILAGGYALATFLLERRRERRARRATSTPRA